MNVFWSLRKTLVYKIALGLNNKIPESQMTFGILVLRLNINDELLHFIDPTSS